MNKHLTVKQQSELILLGRLAERCFRNARLYPRLAVCCQMVYLAALYGCDVNAAYFGPWERP